MGKNKVSRNGGREAWGPSGQYPALIRSIGGDALSSVRASHHLPPPRLTRRLLTASREAPAVDCPGLGCDTLGRPLSAGVRKCRHQLPRSCSFSKKESRILEFYVQSLDF